MAELDRKPDANERAARGLHTGFWAGILGALVIAIAAAFFIANREEMGRGAETRGAETTGSATDQNMGMKNPDPAANTPNTPERRQ